MTNNYCYIVIIILAIIIAVESGIIIWLSLYNKKQKQIHKGYNCIKVDIKGDNVKEWVDFTINIDGIEYYTLQKYITNDKSHIINNNNSVNNSLLIKNVWKDGKNIYVPTIINKDSKVDVKIKFLYSEFYTESKLTSYKARIINCP